MRSTSLSGGSCNRNHSPPGEALREGGTTGEHFYKLVQIDFDGTRHEIDPVTIEVSNPLPNEYVLSQNYPNPFNPTTTIKFSLPYAGNITLSVFNVIGEEVQNLENGYKEAGSYEVNFDASKLTSGFYFYQLNAGDFKQTKKMILLK